MSQSQLHKAKKSLDKLEALYLKTLRRLDNIKKEAVKQKQILDEAKLWYQRLDGGTNAVHPTF